MIEYQESITTLHLHNHIDQESGALCLRHSGVLRTPTHHIIIITSGPGEVPLHDLSMTAAGYSVDQIANEIKSAQIFIVPLNSNLDTLIGNTAPGSASSVSELVPCGNCGMDVSLITFSLHRAACGRNVEGEDRGEDGRVEEVNEWKKGMKEALHG